MRVMDKEKDIRQRLYRVVEEYYSAFHKNKKFIPGETYIPYAGRVYDSDEMKALLDSCLDFWLTAGRFARNFEEEFSRILGVKHCLLTNSGSSANLLAISALTSPKLGKRRLKPGDEVITTACAFPTTVNPIIQNNLTPVFLDVEMGTYNIRAEEIGSALSKKTKAIFLAHTLGNPFNLDKVLEIAKKRNLWVIEDSSDALGARYKGTLAGTFGHMSTFSFYPAHHITMGEGGAVTCNDAALRNILASFRDWGRDCWCEPGKENSCGKRFKLKLGDLPFGYDHKYVYSHIGYNLKITDMQAAIGLTQLKKLPSFIKTRKENWNFLYSKIKKFKKYFILPEITENSEPSWFGFVVTVREKAPFTRNDMVKFLEKNKIATRMLFAGNITRHPALFNVKYRFHKSLDNTDNVMNNTFWVGVYPGMTGEMLGYISRKIEEFVEKKEASKYARV